MNKNNNSPSKGNGYVRFAVKTKTDEQDVSLMVNDDDDSDDICQHNSDQNRKVNGAGCSHNMRVTIGGTKVRRTRHSSCRLKCFVFLSGITIIVSMVLIFHFYNNRKKVISIGEGSLGLAQLCLADKALELLDHERSVRATFSLGGANIPSMKYDAAENCGDSSTTMSGLCLNWPAYETKLRITPVMIKETNLMESIQCYKVSWSFKERYAPEDCVYLDDVKDGVKIADDLWYDTQNFLLWPVESGFEASSCVESCQQYVPGGINSGGIMPKENMGGTVVEPFWVSSGAVTLKASLHDPLMVCSSVCQNITRSKLCLKTQADPSHQHQAHLEEAASNLTYVACVGHNTTHIFQETMNALLKPKAPPSDILLDVINDGVFYDNPTSSSAANAKKGSLVENCSKLLKKPLWNIILKSDEYDSAAIQKDLKHIADIGGTGYLSNLSEVFTKIGDFDLRNDTNAKPVDIVTALHEMDWEVMLPVSPFVNYDSDNFRKSVTRQMLIRNEAGTAPMLINIPHFGDLVLPGVIDFTNPEASRWFAQNLEEFKKTTGIDNIHLYYGQASWLPDHYSLHTPLHNPGFYSMLYTDVANEVSPCPVTDVAFSSQNDLQFVMLNPAMDLQGTLRVGLASGLAGYPFFIPNLPSRLEDATSLGKDFLEEGFIRWVQLLTFFPAIHVPWDFQTLSSTGVNVTRLAECVKKCTALRNSPELWPVLEAAMLDAENGGAKPIISPIWMAPGTPPVTNDEFDKEIYEIQDQFMVGNRLMVAPMLEMGDDARIIYFPQGRWKALAHGMKEQVIVGGQWFRNYKVGLDELPVFLRHDVA